ncbi:isochorismate synthase [Anabaena azotica]|uniref:Isochorismate synthase n=1 Tax=Anabaena azotica FACHB-119 TaxID=947527 RepID=A0ABR8D407_9NOST|nr:isochorismate synthase [Anabaena azotica]MBD2500498.1 isochorismate synthase [Anabaena azotica FACHB-119]
MSLTFIEETLEYVAEAVAELFSPNHDNYPSTGYQPFEGEPYKDKPSLE